MLLGVREWILRPFAVSCRCYEGLLKSSMFFWGLCEVSWWLEVVDEIGDRWRRKNNFEVKLSRYLNGASLNFLCDGC